MWGKAISLCVWDGGWEAILFIQERIAAFEI